MAKTNSAAMHKIFVIVLSVFLIISCADKKDPIGIWDDNIKLSKKSVDFSAETDSVTITTEGDWWWVNGIAFEDSIYHYSGREDIDIEADSYSIKEDCFGVERRNKNTLFVKIDKNRTGYERMMNISLQAGNYFDDVYINQAAN